MSVIQPGNLYHTGIVVDDLDAAAAQITAATGTRWSDPIEFTMNLRYQDGDRKTDLAFRYSLSAPHIEILRAVPGTVITAAPDNAIHHLGYWVDDLAEAAAYLTGLGMTQEVCGLDDNGRPMRFAYFLAPGGPRIEIVDRPLLGDWHSFLNQYTPKSN
ncbi:VOC family protein [Streptomyces olivoreticuli]